MAALDGSSLPDWMQVRLYCCENMHGCLTPSRAMVGVGRSARGITPRWSLSRRAHRLLHGAQDALCHVNPDTRSDALHLVCASRRASAPASRATLDAVRMFLRASMTETSSGA